MDRLTGDPVPCIRRWRWWRCARCDGARNTHEIDRDLVVTHADVAVVPGGSSKPGVRCLEIERNAPEIVGPERMDMSFIPAPPMSVEVSRLDYIRCQKHEVVPPFRSSGSQLDASGRIDQCPKRGVQGDVVTSELRARRKQAITSFGCVGAAERQRAHNDHEREGASVRHTSTSSNRRASLHAALGRAMAEDAASSVPSCLASTVDVAVPSNATDAMLGCLHRHLGRILDRIRDLAARQSIGALSSTFRITHDAPDYHRGDRPLGRLLSS